MEKKQILVVDDEVLIAQDIANILGDLGYGVCSLAFNVDDAIAKAKSDSPDLVLMDIRLSSGDRDGIDAAEVIIKEQGIPVIFITAYSDNNNFIRAKKLGTCGYLLKPFDKEELYKTIELALARHEKHSVLADAVEANKMTHDILEKSPFGVMVIDAEGYVELVNPAMIIMSGESKEDLLSVNVFNHDTYQRIGLSDKIKSALTGENFFLGPVEYSSLKKKDLAVKNYTGIPFVENHQNKVILYVEDITHRMSVEAELQLSFWKLQKTIETTIYAIAKMVEKRDPYTAGHQERVARLAAAIASKMDLTKDKIDSTYMAALIHDVGKMYIPSEILTKPGQLTMPEFSMIKTHAEFGSDILGGIEFPWPVAQSVVQHHERMDGSGYPSGLSKDQIIIEARIIAVADVVEAMASHRPYRPSLGIVAAIDEIKKNRGIRYDSDVVDACVDLYDNDEFDFTYDLKED